MRRIQTRKMAGPLKEIRVLEVGKALAGPQVGMLLADMGAEVIKVEVPRVGDECRYWSPQVQGIGTFFLAFNRNKKSITLNLKSKKGIGIFYELAKKSDIVIENNRVGMMDKLGIGYSDLKKIKPDIIFTSVTGFGQTGPYAPLPAYEIIAQAMGGMMDLTGFPDGPPVRTGPGLGDILAALYALYGTMVALYYREKTGEGQYVDASIFESVAASLENVITNFDLLGIVAKRVGSRVRTITPYNCYQVKDGYVVIAVGNDEQWKKLASAIGRKELAESPQFGTNLKRVESADEVDKILQAWLDGRTLEESIQILRKADVPCAPVYSIDQMVKDPQFTERKLAQKVSYEGLDSFDVIGILPKLSLSPGEIHSNPPTLGQHNDEIFGTLLGYPKEEIRALEKEGVV
jgi:crotonobetainyl-CoA:carnitine CoA-transferase CaiB-like acyl-CoA transferase